MTRYQNRSGQSGVIAYEAGTDFIKLQFKDGIYLYNHQCPGKSHVDKMKELAIAGSGLATYVNQHVRENYARKLS